MATGKELMNDNIRETHWIGEVVDNNDPKLLGRCKVKVFGKFDKLTSDAIPWATPMNRDFVGSHNTPHVGSVVAVRFDNGNIYHPEYWFQVDQSTALKSDILEGSGEAHNVVSLIYDEVRNVRIYHSPEDGLVITRGTGAKERPIIQLDENGTIKISSDDKIFLDAGNVYLSNTGEEGDDTSEPAVRGKSLEKFLDKLKAEYNAHTHPVAGPNTGPVVKQWAPKHKPYQQEGK